MTTRAESQGPNAEPTTDPKFKVLHTNTNSAHCKKTDIANKQACDSPVN